MIRSIIMQKIFKIALLGAMLTATPALANSAQIAVAKKAVQSGKIAPYATPELKQLLKKAHQIDDIIRNQDPDGLGCDFHEHFYVGWEQDDPRIKNWKASAKNNVVHITFKDSGNFVSLKFKMKGNLIDDVNSIKRDARTMINTGNCVS